jgi:hypothetical protein
MPNDDILKKTIKRIEKGMISFLEGIAEQSTELENNHLKNKNEKEPEPTAEKEKTISVETKPRYEMIGEEGSCREL